MEILLCFFRRQAWIHQLHSFIDWAHTVLTSYWECRGFDACSRTLSLVSPALAPVLARSQGSRQIAGVAEMAPMLHSNSCCLCPTEILLQLFSRNGVRGPEKREYVIIISRGISLICPAFCSWGSKFPSAKIFEHWNGK